MAELALPSLALNHEPVAIPALVVLWTGGLLQPHWRDQLACTQGLCKLQHVTCGAVAAASGSPSPWQGLGFADPLPFHLGIAACTMWNVHRFRFKTGFRHVSRAQNMLVDIVVVRLPGHCLDDPAEHDETIV
ncbi:hypothetical protein D3C71_1262260 [compost metagenome]